jgi:predicted CXXCH cytochrome family protein
VARRKNPQPPTGSAQASTAQNASPAAAGKRRLRRFMAAGAAVAIAIAGAAYWVFAARAPSFTRSATTTIESRASAQHVGAGACMQCHQPQFKAWTGSHHQLAMQEANDSTVLGDFNNARFRRYGIESTFFRRDGKFMVRTDGPDGKLADFEISYAFGVWPLQQYLIGFPGGRYQTLGIAWDARTKGDGGQRWFHIYPNEKMDHNDQLHWTGLYQNWNLQCAACHSTNLKKGYDAASNAYKTTFSEINVACEACHGPASRHVEWAKQARAPYSSQGDKGLVVLRSRWNEAWKFPTTDAKYAQRDRPADAAAMNTCAACHARRSTLAEGGTPGAPLEDTHRLAMLTPPNYHADGQQREEVYVWSSFLQTEMVQKGVTCMDCHDAHTLKLRDEGNALCNRCHNAALFDTDKHHFHKAGTKGAQCVECHMPAQNYMVIDARRDHGIRVPRPDLSPSLGSPNACTQCHTGRKPEWTADAMDKWYGKTWRARPQYGTTLHAATTQGAKALPSLLALANDPAAPSIVRATAATLAQPYVNPGNLPALRNLLAHADPTLRITALGLLEPFEPAVRAQAAAPLLASPVRGVRIEAARILADVGDDRLFPDQRSNRGKAINEYVESLQQDSDWPAANVTFGNLRMRQGRPEEAIAAYERALSLDARFAGAYVNLADAYRQHKRESDGERVLRRGIALLPRAADLHHTLGLLLVRKGDKAAGLRELSEAAKLAPDNARYAYVYAIGLHSAGKRGEALATLRRADARHPYDLEILGALVSMHREAGDDKAALAYAKKAAEALPEDASVRRLVADLEGKK